MSCASPLECDFFGGEKEYPQNRLISCKLPNNNKN